MADIIISREAQADFKRIWHYIALDDEAAADRLLLAIDEKIGRLRDFPNLGAPRDEIFPGAHTLVHGSYLVLYEYDPAVDQIEIVAVVEGMRDLDRLF